MPSTALRYFSREELACPCCGQMVMDPGFVAKLVELRETYGKPMRIVSAYRCPDREELVSGRRDGPHTKGYAVDIQVSGTDAYELLYFAVGYGIPGIGVHQSGPHEHRFIHLDRLESIPGRPRPRLWSYGMVKISETFSGGKTMNYLLERAKEPSTWRGMILFATGFGVTLSPEMTAQIVATGTAMAGLVGMFSSDGPEK